MNIAPPRSLVEEHEELRRFMERAAGLDGDAGDPEMRVTYAYTGWLKEHLEDMKAEHRMIGAALEALLAAAPAGQAAEYVEFAEKLLNHARMEEEILYPAAILAGEFLRVRLGHTALAQ